VKPVARIEAIRDPSAVLTREERGIVAALVRQIAGVHVAGSVLQPAGEALRDGNCARVVIAYCSVRFHERKTAGGIGNLRTYEGVPNSVFGYLINVRDVTQRGSVAAVISQAQARVETQVALKRQVPLLDVGVFIMQVHQRCE